MQFKLVVGLGNPGESYAHTYHNVGFLALDAFILKQYPNPRWRRSMRKPFIYFRAPHKPALFVKPLTFMNESGRAVRAALRFFRLPVKRLIVVHDESDLPLGTLKMSTTSSSAGHRGVQSVIEALGTTSFLRVRIGVRAVQKRRSSAGSFVLNRITRAHDTQFQLVFEEVAAMIEKLIENEQVPPLH